MFDIGFSELLVIGIVTLIVVGPERLPKVARTAGHLFGRLQRYVSDVKQQVKQEMDADDLKNLQTQFQEMKDAASGVEHSIRKDVAETESTLLKAVDAPPASLDFVEEPASHEVRPPEPSPQLELPLPESADKKPPEAEK